jgi:hypothetical protein
MGTPLRRQAQPRSSLEPLQPEERAQNHAGCIMHGTKEQAQLLRRIALAGGRCLAEECHGPALEALIATGFVQLQYGDCLALNGCRMGTRSRATLTQALLNSTVYRLRSTLASNALGQIQQRCE